MHDSEAIQMMKRASHEIKTLRRTIDQLAPKADAYDAIRQMQDLMPRRSQGMSEDVAYLLDRRIKELQDQPKPTSETDQ
jgi:hypothetical protein